MTKAALEFVDLAYHDKAGAANTAAVKFWAKFNKFGLGAEGRRRRAC